MRSDLYCLRCNLGPAQQFLISFCQTCQNCIASTKRNHALCCDARWTGCQGLWEKNKIKSVMGVRSIASLVQSGLPLGLVVFRDINLNRPFSCYADYTGTAVLDTSGFSPQWQVCNTWSPLFLRWLSCSVIGEALCFVMEQQILNSLLPIADQLLITADTYVISFLLSNIRYQI